MRAALVICLLLKVAVPAAAQDGLRALQKERDVAVRIPHITSFAKGHGFRSFEALVDVSDSVITINRNSEWLYDQPAQGRRTHCRPPEGRPSRGLAPQLSPRT
ncbi:MAG: hypothetical protein R2910_03455 [Gemmatimonadales bacterium]